MRAAFPSADANEPTTNMCRNFEYFVTLARSLFSISALSSVGPIDAASKSTGLIQRRGRFERNDRHFSVQINERRASECTIEFHAANALIASRFLRAKFSQKRIVGLKDIELYSNDAQLPSSVIMYRDGATADALERVRTMRKTSAALFLLCSA